LAAPLLLPTLHLAGGDSGIGRAVAVHFAREGAAGIAITYLDEARDAQETVRACVRAHVRACTWQQGGLRKGLRDCPRG